MNTTPFTPTATALAWSRSSVWTDETADVEDELAGAPKYSGNVPAFDFAVLDSTVFVVAECTELDGTDTSAVPAAGQVTWGTEYEAIGVMLRRLVAASFTPGTDAGLTKGVFGGDQTWCFL